MLGSGSSTAIIDTSLLIEGTMALRTDLSIQLVPMRFYIPKAIEGEHHMSGYVPKKGDRIRLNPECVEEVERAGFTLAGTKTGELDEWEVLDTCVDSDGDIVICVRGRTLDFLIHPNGSPFTYRSSRYSQDMFLKVADGPAMRTLTIPPSPIYCSCDGEKVSNVAGGNPFIHCRGCGKEVLS
jgi:hypothetical protein